MTRRAVVRGLCKRVRSRCCLWQFELSNVFFRAHCFCSQLVTVVACVFEAAYVRADTVADLLYVDLDQLEWRRLPAGQEKRMHDGAQKLYLGMGVASGGLFPVHLQARNANLWLFRSQKFTNEVLVRRVEAGRKQLSIYASLLDQGVAFQALNSFTGRSCAP